MRSQLAHGGDYFDPTLAKYKPKSVLSVVDPDIQSKPVPKLIAILTCVQHRIFFESGAQRRFQKISVAHPSAKRCKELWEQYLHYKSSNASPKTINGTYQPVTSYLEKCSIDELQDALKFRMELLQVTTQSQARRALMQLSACCK